MTLSIAVLVVAIVACLVCVIAYRKGLSIRDLSVQLLVTLIGTYLGVAASLETSRRLAEEQLTEVVVGQTKLALSKLSIVKAGIDAKRPDAYIDRRIATSVPALRRLAGLEGAHRVLGLHVIGALDDVGFYVDEYATDKRRAAALRSHLADVWRLLSVRLATVTGEEQFAHCDHPNKIRTCDAEIATYLRSSLTDPNYPYPTRPTEN